MIEDKGELIVELERLKTLCHGNAAGICYNVSTRCAELITELAQGWEHYTGYRYFPIPGGRLAYLTLPHWEGEQLMYRLSLIDYLIDKLKEEGGNE